VNRKFRRRKEDFICLNCGYHVRGNGYTNHCPACLFSKHVDINPGDRQCSCLGLMKPVGAESVRGGYVIIHQCIKCGAKKRNKAAQGDSFDAIVKASSGGGRDE
jgi:hypothetical protein